MEIHAIGIDLGKTLFHLVGVDSCGTVVVGKRCSRSQLLVHPERTDPADRNGGPLWLSLFGRALREQGHDVRFMPAQYVKPYVKTNKSDYIDAEGIAEAVQRPTVRFVPIKTEEQLDLRTMHRGPNPTCGCAKAGGGTKRAVFGQADVAALPFVTLNQLLLVGCRPMGAPMVAAL